MMVGADIIPLKGVRSYDLSGHRANSRKISVIEKSFELKPLQLLYDVMCSLKPYL